LSSSDFTEIQETAEIIGKIAADERAFRAIIEAHENEEADTFQEELSKLGLLDHCEKICFWICFKRCVHRCEFFCPTEQQRKDQIETEEMIKFAKEVLKLIQDKEMLNRLLEAYDKKDAKTFQEILKKLGLLFYCKQICSWFCHVRCRRVCINLCPLPPRITHVGFIPTNQFTPAGYAKGPNSAPPAVGTQTIADNHVAGVGDHPFGLSTQIRGVFNIANAKQYRVEYGPSLTGPWTIIDTPVQDAVYLGIDPVVPKPDSITVHNDYNFFGLFVYTRSPLGGWYDVDDMGEWSMNHSYLTDWNTPIGTGTYYLRLTVKRLTPQEFISPLVKVQVDNESPTIDQPVIFLEKPDGSVVPLECCGGVKKGDGIIQIHIRAFDKNFSRLSLVAKYGCSAYLDIVDEVSGTAVTRTYNGNISDQGETATRIVRWDPWKAIKEEGCCCYHIELWIADRTIINNNWNGYTGHGSGPKFVSLQICA